MSQRSPDQNNFAWLNEQSYWMEERSVGKYEIGILAMRKLHRLIEGNEMIPVKSVVYRELIVRESC